MSRGRSPVSLVCGSPTRRPRHTPRPHSSPPHPQNPPHPALRLTRSPRSLFILHLPSHPFTPLPIRPSPPPTHVPTRLSRHRHFHLPSSRSQVGCNPSLAACGEAPHAWLHPPLHYTRGSTDNHARIAVHSPLTRLPCSLISFAIRCAEGFGWHFGVTLSVRPIRCARQRSSQRNVARSSRRTHSLLVPPYPPYPTPP